MFYRFNIVVKKFIQVESSYKCSVFCVEFWSVEVISLSDLNILLYNRYLRTFISIVINIIFVYPTYLFDP